MLRWMGLRIGPASGVTGHTNMVIERDRVVRFHYSFAGEDGQVIESSREHDPVAVLQGHGNIVRGVDDALVGHAAGDSFQVTVAPEDAYGRRMEGRTRRVAKKHVRGPKRLKPGDQVLLETTQGIRDVTVLKVGRTVVDVDMNHPLAGQTLVFDIEILEVREAGPEEIAHGHVHGPGGHAH